MNALIALAAALSWGAGDFSGAMGVKAAGGTTRGATRIILVAHIASLIVLAAVIFLTHQVMPHGAFLGWALLAGLSVGFSLTAFYIALSRGEMGVSAAISGLLAAAIPAIVSTVLEGAPGILKLLGFALALVAIWAIAAAPSQTASPRSTLWLAIFAGIGFGIYFVALRQANPLGVVMPMAIARVASILMCSLALLAFRLFATDEGPTARRLSATALTWAMGAALMDTGGNLLFVWATRLGRLDVAAVLASLYPAGTILLAAWRLHETPTRRQLSGMALAIVAVIMITL